MSAIFVVALLLFPLVAWTIGAWPELAWVGILLAVLFVVWILPDSTGDLGTAAWLPTG